MIARFHCKNRGQVVSDIFIVRDWDNGQSLTIILGYFFLIALWCNSQLSRTDVFRFGPTSRKMKSASKHSARFVASCNAMAFGAPLRHGRASRAPCARGPQT